MIWSLGLSLARAFLHWSACASLPFKEKRTSSDPWISSHWSLLHKDSNLSRFKDPILIILTIIETLCPYSPSVTPYTLHYRICLHFIAVCKNLTMLTRGVKKGDLKLRQAAIRQIGSRQPNMAENRIILPVWGSSGSRARWYPKGSNSSLSSKACWKITFQTFVKVLVIKISNVNSALHH